MFCNFWLLKRMSKSLINIDNEYFSKCNFPINHTVCLSVCRSKKKFPNYLNVRILGKCRLLLLLLKTPSPPIKQTHNNFNRQWGGGDA